MTSSERIPCWRLPWYRWTHREHGFSQKRRSVSRAIDNLGQRIRF